MCVLAVIEMLDEMVFGKQKYNDDGSARMVTGLLYLKFSNEKEANQWNETFRVLVNHHWMNKLKKDTPLHIIAVSHQNAKDTLDVFFAETDEIVWDIASMRFGGQLMTKNDVVNSKNVKRNKETSLEHQNF